MHKASFVKMLDAPEQLVHHFPSLLKGRKTILLNPAKKRKGQVLHHDVGGVVGLEDALQCANIFMVQQC